MAARVARARWPLPALYMFESSPPCCWPRLAAPEESVCHGSRVWGSPCRAATVPALFQLGLTDSKMWQCSSLAVKYGPLGGSAPLLDFRTPSLPPLAIQLRAMGGGIMLRALSGILHDDRHRWRMQDIWVFGAHRFFLGLVDSERALHQRPVTSCLPHPDLFFGGSRPARAMTKTQSSRISDASTHVDFAFERVFLRVRIRTMHTCRYN